jgi:hypothetical protein
MLRVPCTYCRRHGSGALLPRGWKICGVSVLCQQCRRRRYRLRSITIAVLKPIETLWRELGAAWGESWRPVTLREGTWEARLVEGKPRVRLRITERWWDLNLNGAWSRGQKAVYDKVASGAAAGELFLYRVPRDEPQNGNGSGGGPSACSDIMCRMVAWLPRERIEDAKKPQEALPVRASWLAPGVRHLEDSGIASLREAIRANRVSFPSQVPTFPKQDRPDLQRKLAQLYFVLGWSCSRIGERYCLAPGRVRQILNTWRCQAVRMGYLQHIPPSEVISQLAGCAPTFPLNTLPAG